MEENMKVVSGFEKYLVSKEGFVLGARGKQLNPWIGRGGYLKVCLYNKGSRRWAYVHRLVCECFHLNLFKKKEINHIDGNKFNNMISNLEWVTRSENNIHAFKKGLRLGVRGEKNTQHKITEKDVIEIRKMRGIKSQREIGKIFGLSHSHVGKIQRNQKWTEVAYA
jgi:hypothetical protein